jgi:two-component system cell cycle response regulator DivK
MNSSQPRKILIAEDNLVSRELLHELLELDGHEVVDAINGREALDLLEKEPTVQIVLLDLDMPVLDGFGALQQLRLRPGFELIAAVAVTAHAMLGDRERILNAGFDGYVSKPIDRQALRDELARVSNVRTQPQRSAAASHGPSVR